MAPGSASPRGASSSRATKEATNRVEGRAIREAREARARDEIKKIVRPLRPDYEYTLRQVDHRHPRRPTDYTLGENQSMINCNEDPSDWTTELHDCHFWNNFQADWYLTIIKDRRNPITSQLYIDLTYMQNKCDPVFNKVITKAHDLGFYIIIGMYQEWNTKLVAQFCSIAWRSGNGYDSTINFSIEGHRFSVCAMEFQTIFGLTHNDLHRAEIPTEQTIMKNELAPLYYPGNENFYGKTHGLLAEYAIFNNMFCNTLTPKHGDHTSIHGTTRNLLLAILDNKPPPCISTFHWMEFMFMLKHGTTYVIYALCIQRIINYKTDIEFVYDGKYGSYQPHVIRGNVDPLLLLLLRLRALQMQPLLLLLPVHLLLLL
jgi:hypothetical protein